MRRALVLVVLVLTLLAGYGCGEEGGSIDPVDTYSTVEAYCSYGAVSQAQLDHCVEHVDEATVDGYDTNAAEYARGELDHCLSDSGPFCEERTP